jgi:Ca2+-binding EF-hand superfamily protein
MSTVCSTMPETTWSECELQNLRDAFELLDTEHNGEILIDDLRSTLVELSTLKSSNIGTRNIQGLLISLQSFRSDAKLSLIEFVSLLTSPSSISLKDDVEKVFELFDTNGKGYINMEDLVMVAQDLGERNVSDAEMHEMIQRVSSSGQVTLDQFREIMKNNVSL